jgi:ribosomal protein L13E
MDRQTLFAALAKKQIPQFATSVLGFTIGSLMDYGVSEEEARELCGFLIDQISEAKKNPEILDSAKKFSTVLESSIAGGH